MKFKRKDGSEIDLSTFRIPDLWKVADAVRGQFTMGPMLTSTGKACDASKEIVNCWHLLHELRDFVLAREYKPVHWFVWRLESETVSEQYLTIEEAGKAPFVGTEEFDQKDYELWICFADENVDDVKLDVNALCEAGKI